MIDLLSHIVGVAGWSLLSLGVAAAFFPYGQRVFSPALAWPLCRLTAVATLTAIHLWPTFFLTVPLTPLATVGILAGVVALAPLVTGISYRHSLKEFFAPAHLRNEAFILGVAFFFLAIGLFNPSVGVTGERMRDTAYWVALHTQRQFPILDPWLAGNKIPYYLMGYVVHAEILQFLPISALVSYNVALALCAAVYAFALRTFFSLVWSRRGFASGAALVVLLASNVKSLMCAYQHIATGGGGFNFWVPSRVIPGTINEFPIWTATFGDLHAHFMALWLVPTLSAFCLCAWQGKRDRGETLGVPQIVFLSLIVSWLFGMNTWEFPIGFGLGSLLVAGINFRSGSRRWIADYGVFLGALLLLILPYAFGAATGPKRFLWVETRSTMTELFQVFGQWFVPLVALMAYRLKQHPKKEWIATFALAMVLPFVFESGLLGLLILCVALAFCFRIKSADDQLILATAACGLLLCVLCEVVHLRDAFAGDNARMNTVFKLFLPAWTFLGMAAMLTWKEIFRACEGSPHRRLVRSFFTLWLVLSSSYLLIGVRARSNNFTLPKDFSGWGEFGDNAKDDMLLVRWMARQVSVGELAGNIIELPAGCYKWPGRASALSGLNNFVAWEGYSYWWQVGQNHIYSERFALAKKIFDGTYFDFTPSCQEFTKRLQAQKLDYVFLGKYEREKISPYTLDQLTKCLTAEMSFGDARLFSVRSGLATR